MPTKRRKTGAEEELDNDSSLEDGKLSDDEDDGDGDGGDDDDDDEEDPMTRFRRGEQLEDDLDLEDDSQDSMEVTANEDDGEWNEMGAALEREFLSD